MQVHTNSVPRSLVDEAEGERLRQSEIWVRDKVCTPFCVAGLYWKVSLFCIFVFCILYFPTKKTFFDRLHYAAFCYNQKSDTSKALCPYLFFSGWHKGMPVPQDIYTLYVVQAGYYIHALYAVLFMDVWRKDSILTFSHHILTISLIVLSFSLR